MPQKINLLIFDLDGTLIDSKRDIANCVHWTLRDLSLPQVSDEEIYSYVGNGVRPLIQKSVGEEEGPNFQKALQIFKDYYGTHSLDCTVPMEGALEILEHFKGKKKAVFTNKPQYFTEPILKGLKLDHYFDEVIGSESGFPKKPDPTIVHHLMKTMKCLPAETVLIGDSKIDIETGKNARVLTCGYLKGFRSPNEVRQAKPDFVISELRELKSLFC
ncbi:MAG: HAD-IA family hydrolase [Deltaproteobacteria bacterium]|nr:HAD-IA family hydrolase [Deltaproteobacteria bacterium]